MECKVCGHVHRVWDEKYKQYAYKDTDPFIQIEGHFSITEFLDDKKDVELFACPKCMTIQLNIPKTNFLKKKV